jgi:DUF4097 and DUF4098 domain-containing protein YvlB
MKRIRATLAVTAAALLTGLSSHEAGAQRTRGSFGSDLRSSIDTTIAFDRNGTVTLIAPTGDIVVTGSTNGQLHVRASGDNENIRFEASASRMTLEVGGSHRGGDTKFEVSVPQGVRVLARAQSGDISIRGTRGEVEANSYSGDIVVEDVTSRLTVNSLSGSITAANIVGDLEVVSTSGDVKINDLRGIADVTTVSGDIDLRGLTSKEVRAKTTSGDVTFDGLVDPQGRYEFGAHSGDIRLHVQRDASAQLSVSTWNGGIDSQFPITLKPGAHGIGAATSKRFTFDIGAGSARISAETFSGDITVSSNGHGASERR